LAKERVDHRKTERFRLQVPAKVHKVPPCEGEDCLELTTKDVCSGGAYFQTDKPLPLGTGVKVELILPLAKIKKVKGKRVHVRVSGAVIRISEAGMAVCFEDDYEITPLP
jgi:hypothetical protein